MTQNSPYDIYLGDISSLQGFRCGQFSRDSAPLVASRFSTGAQGETDLDLLKSVSVEDLSGGMFQRIWNDPQKVARAAGFYNKYDNSLYPTLPLNAYAALNAAYALLAKAETDLYTFVAYGYISAGNVNQKLFKMTRGSNTMTAITSLPAAIGASTTGVSALITGMVVHKGYLFVQGATTVGATHINTWRYDIAADTWQDVGLWGVIPFVLRNQLYMIGYLSDIFSVTNETIAGSATYTKLVDAVGISDPINGLATDVKEFNGAAWIAKPDGLFRFDGVAAVKVLSLNVANMTVFNGALYFTSGNWLYRFDGTNVVKLQFFGTAETVKSLSATPDYLLVSTVMVTQNSYADSDKPTIIIAGQALVRMYTFDGASFYLIAEKVVSYNGSFPFNVFGAYVGNRIMLFSQNQNSEGWYIDTTGLFTAAAVTSSSLLEITTSDFDDGYTNIYKSLELIESQYQDIAVGDTITVKYQYYDGKTWSAWITAGTLTSTSINLVEITDATKKLFKQVRVLISATLTSGSTLKLKGGSLRYTLQPRARWRWQALLLAEGNSQLVDRNNNAITTDANAISNIVLKAIRQKTPLFMGAPDYGLVKTQISAVALSFVVKGQIAIYADPYNEYPLCIVKNQNGVWEVLRVSAVSYNGGTDETTITVFERGYFGVTAAIIPADAEFHLAYKVFITRLMRDSPTLDVNTYNQQDPSGESQIQREFLVEITET